MKRKTFALMLSAIGMSSAFAQSSVTLYGRIASGLDVVTNQATAPGQEKTALRFGSNQYGPSWWGLKGQEDLGGGYHAVFNLESMFTAGTGQVIGASLFNRYAYVGLANDQYGSVWMGRAMSLTDEIGYYLDPFGEQATGIGNFARGRAWGSRANTVTYNSPKLAGFSFRLQSGLGNEAGNFRGARQLSASATYAIDGFNAFGVYEEIRDANGKFSDPFSASREYMIGATYQFVGLKLYAGYQALVSSGKDTLTNADNVTASTRAQQGWFGATYQVDPALAVQAAVFHGITNHGGGVGTLGVLGTTYNLSKRTFVYATFGAMFNGKNANYSFETGDTGPLPGRTQAGGYFGVMHYF